MELSRAARDLQVLLSMFRIIYQCNTDSNLAVPLLNPWSYEVNGFLENYFNDSNYSPSELSELKAYPDGNNTISDSCYACLCGNGNYSGIGLNRKLVYHCNSCKGKYQGFNAIVTKIHLVLGHRMQGEVYPINQAWLELLIAKGIN